jgi:WD40 repeat protein
MFGDFTIEIMDINRQRRERLERHYAPMTSDDFSCDTQEIFALNDLVITNADLQRKATFRVGNSVDFRLHGAVVSSAGSMPHRIRSLAPLATGRLFFAATPEDEVVVLRDARTRSEVRRQPDWRTAASQQKLLDRVASVVVSPNEDRYATVFVDGTVIVRDVDSEPGSAGSPTALVPSDTGSSGVVTCAVFACPNLLLTGDSYGFLRQWKLSSGTSIFVPRHGRVRRGAMSLLRAERESGLCLSAGQDGFVFVWPGASTDDESCVTYSGHETRSVKAAEFLDAQTAVSVCDRAVHVWRTENGTALRKITHSGWLTQPPPRAAAPPKKSRSGRIVAPSPTHGGTSLWDGRTALFGPTGGPSARVITVGALLRGNGKFRAMCLADTCGMLHVVPLDAPSSSSGAAATGADGFLRFRAPLTVLVGSSADTLLAGDGFGNIFSIAFDMC